MQHVMAASGQMPASALALNWRRIGVLVVAMSIVLCIGLADYWTGWELSLYLFYAVPILFLVWQGEQNGALVLALLCGIVWWVANDSSNPYQSAWLYRWASISRAVYFILVAIGGNALRAKQEGDRARIAALERSRRLELEIVSAGEREQQRIGRDLHDSLCQQLAAIGCAARSLANKLHAVERPESADAEQIETYINDSVAQARKMARGIVPVVAGGTGLAISLDELASTTSGLTGVKVTFQEEGDVRVNDLEVAMHLYRIAQEALNNAVRHSGARAIAVTLHARGDVLRLTVADDGCGLGAGAEECAGMGFRTMEYRAHAIGAQLSITSRRGNGVLVDCSIRLDNVKSHGQSELKKRPRIVQRC